MCRRSSWIIALATLAAQLCMPLVLQSEAHAERQRRRADPFATEARDAKAARRADALERADRVEHAAERARERAISRGLPDDHEDVRDDDRGANGDDE